MQNKNRMLSLTGTGMEEQAESTEMFEIIGTTKHPPAVKGRTEEEARQAMLK